VRQGWRNEGPTGFGGMQDRIGESIGTERVQEGSKRAKGRETMRSAMGPVSDGALWVNVRAKVQDE